MFEGNIEAGRWHTAWAYAEQWRRPYYGQAAAFAELAVALERSGRTSAATAAFVRARKAIDDTLLRSLMSQADDQHRDCEAESFLSRTMEYDLIRLGAAFDEAGRSAQATAVYAELRRLFADVSERQLDNLSSLALNLVRVGRLEEADTCLAKVRAAALSLGKEMYARDSSPWQTSFLIASAELVRELSVAGQTARAVELLALAWTEAKTAEALKLLFEIDAALLRAYPELGAGFAEAFRWAQDQLGAILDRARACGELRDGVDLDLAVHMLVGAYYA